MEFKKVPMWKLVIIAVALSLTACSSMELEGNNFEPNAILEAACESNNAEACRQLGIEYGDQGGNARMGIRLLNRSCELGSQLGCKQANYVRAFYLNQASRPIIVPSDTGMNAATQSMINALTDRNKPAAKQQTCTIRPVYVFDKLVEYETICQ